MAAIPHSSVLRSRCVGSQAAPRLVLDLLSCSALLMGQASRGWGGGELGGGGSRGWGGEQQP